LKPDTARNCPLTRMWALAGIRKEDPATVVGQKAAHSGQEV